jgi:hypothetical protein
VNEKPTSGGGEPPEPPDKSARRGKIKRGYILVTCQHCQNGILVPKARRFNEVDCPACTEPNPAPRRDYLAFIKGFFRWLLYPSFQRKD